MADHATCYLPFYINRGRYILDSLEEDTARDAYLFYIIQVAAYRFSPSSWDHLLIYNRYSLYII